MELGELVSPPLPEQETEDGCPFEHEPVDVEVMNELGGVGSKLGDNMTSGAGVMIGQKGTREPDPRSVGVRSVQIVVAGRLVELESGPLDYPLTCAAHHLIPAQESLKGHSILNFMCQKEQDQDFLSGKNKATAPVAGSLVWGSVGYNVNGSENGVWLPGNYAVGGGKGAVEIWKSKPTDKRTTYSTREATENWIRALDLAEQSWTPNADPNENEGPQPGESLADALMKANMREYSLAGTNFDIKATNPKWAYVLAAMTTARGQFHDRHGYYSGEVKQYLTKVFNVYDQKYKDAKSATSKCKKCEDAKRPKKAPKDKKLVGPPKTLIARLTAASLFFRKHLAPPAPDGEKQKLTVRTIYTSEWVNSWMATKP
jgi:hypothetical protein